MKYEVSCTITLYVTPADPDATEKEVSDVALQFLDTRLRDVFPEVVYDYESTFVTVGTMP